MSYRPLLLAAAAACGFGADARGQFNVVFNYGTDAGFSSSTSTGLDRQNVLTQVANQYRTLIDARGTFRLGVSSFNDPSDGTLGFAGSVFNLFPTTQFTNGFVYRDATTRTAAPTADAGGAQFNFAFLNNTVAPATGGRFDFYSVALHEMAHAMAFASFANADGSPQADQTGQFTAYAGYDRYLVRVNGSTTTQLFSTNGSGQAVFNGTPADLASGQVFFDGPMVRKAYGGPVKLFAPSPFDPSSSISHTDGTVANLSAGVMTPAIAPNTSIRTFLAVELAMLIDVGWNTFHWTGTTGNWADNVSNVTPVRWQNADAANMLSPVGTVTPNLVLRFNGTTAYTSTNNLTLTYTQPGGAVANRFLASQVVLNAGGAVLNTIAAGGANVLRFDTTIGVQPTVTQSNAAAFTISHPIEIATGRGLAFEGTGTGGVTVTGVIASVNNTGNAGQYGEGTNGNGGTLFKRGAFTLTLSGANTYQGGTDVSGGTLAVRNLTGSGTGTGTVTVNSGGTLAGSNTSSFGSGTGNVAGPAVVQSGGRVAPRELGTDPGLLRFGGGLTFATGANYTWYLATRTESAALIGQAGGFDQLLLQAGNLSVAGGATMTLSFGTGIGPDTANAFWEGPRQWTVIDVSGGTNTGNTNFGSITNATFPTGAFALAVAADGDLVLTFTPVPEPAFGLAVVVLVGVWVRRRGERPA